MQSSPFRYSPLTKVAKKLYRRFKPVPVSPWTEGKVDDICAVNLVPPEKLVDFFKRAIGTLQESKGWNIGDYFDFGVFNGNSIGSMYIARAQTDVRNMRLFGFDAFEGLPADAEKEDEGVWKKGFYTCSFPQMQTCLQKRGINPGDMEWVQGWYDKTLNASLTEKFNIKDVGIAFIDCDTYSSSKAALDYLAPLIQKPAIICLDDWKLYDLDIIGEGEYRSFNEFLEQNPRIKAEKIKSYNRKSQSFLLEPEI
jgi:O-methyltransferase